MLLYISADGCLGNAKHTDDSMYCNNWRNASHFYFSEWYIIDCHDLDLSLYIAPIPLYCSVQAPTSRQVQKKWRVPVQCYSLWFKPISSSMLKIEEWHSYFSMSAIDSFQDNMTLQNQHYAEIRHYTLALFECCIAIKATHKGSTINHQGAWSGFFNAPSPRWLILNLGVSFFYLGHRWSCRLGWKQ